MELVDFRFARTPELHELEEKLGAPSCEAMRISVPQWSSTLSAFLLSLPHLATLEINCREWNDEGEDHALASFNLRTLVIHIQEGRARAAHRWAQAAGIVTRRRVKGHLTWMPCGVAGESPCFMPEPPIEPEQSMDFKDGDTLEVSSSEYEIKARSTFTNWQKNKPRGISLADWLALFDRNAEVVLDTFVTEPGKHYSFFQNPDLDPTLGPRGRAGG